MSIIHVYADGGCRGNGKEDAIGGYGIILIDYDNKRKKEIKAAFKNTTNNKMELLSVIDALKALKTKQKVKIYSDSAYVVNAFNQNWIKGWLKNNWKNSKKEPVKNRDLWEELIKLTNFHDCEFIKVKGHSDNEFNNRADQLANEAMDNID